MILVLATTWRDELYAQEALEARQLLAAADLSADR
jgi:hypothetical protein